MEVETVRLLVVAVSFNVIVLSLVWHVAILEASSPVRELRDPKVHHQNLSLIEELGGFVPLRGHADLFTIYKPLDVLWMPLDLIHMPVIGWPEVICVGMTLFSELSIAEDDVRAEGTLLY